VQKIIHPDWEEYFERQWQLLLVGVMPPTYEYQIINKSGETRWIHQRNVLVKDEEGHPVAIEGMVSDITEQKEVREALRQSNEELERRVASRTAELNQRSERLAEANIALKVLLEKRQEDKKELEEQVLLNVQKLIFPYLEKLLTRCTDESHVTLLKIIQSNLDEITSAFKHKDYLSELTPAQIQVADLIKQGKTTKEIASLLQLSPSTVACHRQEIRKRLSLNKQKINLRAALTVNTQ